VGFNPSSMQDKMSGPRDHLGCHHRLKVGAMEQMVHGPQVNFTTECPSCASLGAHKTNPK
jgi:hypothetical protein